MSFFRRKTLPSAIKPSVTFGRLLYQRLDHDGLTMLAGHLAYVSLLSLVPLVTVVFAIIIGSVVLQSLTSGMMARWLRVQQQKPRGVLIVGANSVARMLAQAL
ncbi:hypothetical protein, partial [Aeromonas salmonicida]|uniref:hypothetical protein n=1 Tax=Aeromonas salmonicida TaxID=645 RepID=UPI002240C7B6